MTATPASPPVSKDPVGIVVTFQPNLDAVDALLGAVRGGVSATVIVDDGSDEDCANALAALVGRHGATLLRMGRNAGLAAAQNAGMRWARERGADSAVLFDQDSSPDSTMVRELRRAAEALRVAGIAVGAVGPTYLDARSGKTSVPVRRGLGAGDGRSLPPGVTEASFLISSGSYIPFDAFDAAGPMDEGLFIEHVDTDWCLRARKRGLRLFVTAGAWMRHRPGEQLRPIAGGRSIRLHRPLRYYYLFRNSVLLHSRDYAPASWVWYDRLKLAILFFYYALLTPPRRQNAAMMLKGLLDGLRGRAGRKNAERS